MFNDGGYMMDMHGMEWAFWPVVFVAVVVAFLFFGRGRIGSGRDRPSETPHDVLRRPLASGDLTPGEYEERKVVLDRDGSGRV
ncbi:MAG: SHOCT domain-containing protein [Rhizobacter sp.]